MPTEHAPIRDSRQVSATLARDSINQIPTDTITVFGTPDEMFVTTGAEQQLTIYQLENGFSYSDGEETAQVADPWEVVAKFLAGNGGAFMAGYLGFGMHALSEPSLTSSELPVASLVVPSLVYKVKGNMYYKVDANGNISPPHLMEQTIYEVEELGSLTDYIEDDDFEYENRVGETLDWILQASEGESRRATIARRVTIPIEADLIRTIAHPPVDSDSTQFGAARSIYMRFIDANGKIVEYAGLSPELLVEGSGNTVTTYKLSGTYPRSPDEAEDAQLESDFKRDERVIQEHASSLEGVNRALTKIGIVTKTGPAVLNLTNVRHLMTICRTELLGGVTMADVFRTLVLAGVSPSPAGLEIIARVEKEGRGPYYGLAIFVEPHGKYFGSQILRTIFGYDNNYWGYVGGAVTSKSTPKLEADEIKTKLKGTFFVKKTK